MISKQEFNPESYLKILNEAQRQLKGFVVEYDNAVGSSKRRMKRLALTTGVLFSTASSGLDNQPRQLAFTEPAPWEQFYMSIQQLFYVRLIADAEDIVKQFCERNELELFQSRLKSADRIILSIEKRYPISESQKKDIRQLAGIIPISMDYFRAACECVYRPATAEDRIAYFEALVIFRNSAAHSFRVLTKTQEEKVKKAGLGALIMSDGRLGTNPEACVKLLGLMNKFLDELDTYDRSR